MCRLMTVLSFMSPAGGERRALSAEAGRRHGEGKIRHRQRVSVSVFAQHMSLEH